MRKRRKTSGKYTGSRTKYPRGRAPSTLTTRVGKTWPTYNSYLSPIWDPFPARSRAILRYSEVITVDPPLGQPAQWLFRATSIFDPNQSSGGHKPYGYNVYEQIYNKYSVVSSTITVQQTSASNGIMGISITDDTLVAQTFNSVRETKGTSFVVMSNVGVSSKVSRNYARDAVFPEQAPGLTAPFGANPLEETYFHFWHEARNIGIDQGSADFLVTITYVVDMYELKDLGQSL